MEGNKEVKPVDTNIESGEGELEMLKKDILVSTDEIGRLIDEMYDRDLRDELAVSAILNERDKLNTLIDKLAKEVLPVQY